MTENDELTRLRNAMQWLETQAREGRLEIAPSLLGTGFEFGFWRCRSKGWTSLDARAVNAKTLLEAVEAAQR